MVKRPPKRKKRNPWAPKRQPDELWIEPLPDDPSHPWWQLVDENPTLSDRPWLDPEREAEPSLGRWIAALIAVDQRKDQAPLASLLKSDHPLQRYASRYLFDFIHRHQEQDALAQLLAKLQFGAEMSRHDRLTLADLLKRQPWEKAVGNLPASYEIGDENEALGRASAMVKDLINQGKDLQERLDRHMAKGLSLEQALDKEKNRRWIDKDTTLKERVDEFKSQGLRPQQIQDKLVGQGWVRDDETIKQAMSSKALHELTRQVGWTSEEAVPERTVGQAVNIKLSDVRTFEEAVARLTSQHWTINEAADRVSKWWGIPSKKTLRHYCNKGRSSLRAKFKHLPGPKK
jgi:hypothetical protein